MNNLRSKQRCRRIRKTVKITKGLFCLVDGDEYRKKNLVTLNALIILLGARFHKFEVFSREKFAMGHAQLHGESFVNKSGRGIKMPSKTENKLWYEKGDTFTLLCVFGSELINKYNASWFKLVENESFRKL